MKKYDVWLFDCDGVILDSNHIKTEAFWRAGMAYSHRDAETLVQYHVKHGGVSRYEKLEYFFKEIRGETDYNDKLHKMLNEYAAFVEEGLRKCSEVPGVRDFLKLLRKSANVRAYVVSGSDEKELRRVFMHRGLDEYFEGIFSNRIDLEQRSTIC